MNNASKDIQDLLSTMRKRFNLPEVELKELTREEYEQKQVDFYNGSEGNLADIDGYNCTLCHNKGDIQYIKNGYVYTKSCSCMDTRKAIANMKKSGLENIIRDYTFDRFEAKENWQKDMKDKAYAYLKDKEHNWFFIGGNPRSRQDYDMYSHLQRIPAKRDKGKIHAMERGINPLKSRYQ